MSLFPEAFLVQNNPVLANADASALTNVVGNLKLEVFAMPDLDGFSSLMSVQGDFFTESDASLTEIDGLGN